jgi:hypothetical protein
MEKNNNTEETCQITVTKEVREQLHNIDCMLRADGNYKGFEHNLNRAIKYALVQAKLWDGENKHT